MVIVKAPQAIETITINKNVPRKITIHTGSRMTLDSLKNNNTHTHTYTNIHTYIHTYIYTYILTYTHAYIHMYIHTHIYIHTLARRDN